MGNRNSLLRVLLPSYVIFLFLRHPHRNGRSEELTAGAMPDLRHDVMCHPQLNGRQNIELLRVLLPAYVISSYPRVLCPTYGAFSGYPHRNGSQEASQPVPGRVAERITAGCCSRLTTWYWPIYCEDKSTAYYGSVCLTRTSSFDGSLVLWSILNFS